MNILCSMHSCRRYFLHKTVRNTNENICGFSYQSDSLFPTDQFPWTHQYVQFYTNNILVANASGNMKSKHHRYGIGATKGHAIKRENEKIDPQGSLTWKWNELLKHKETSRREVKIPISVLGCEEQQVFFIQPKQGWLTPTSGWS